MSRYRTALVRARAAALTVSLVAGAGVAGGLFATVVGAPGAAFAAAASSVGGQITRSEVLARAEFWFEKGQPYSPNAPTSYTWSPDEQGKSYRNDCSGLVSMAWHINDSFDTGSFPGSGLANKLGSINDLKPGDTVHRAGHMELFAAWKNKNDHSQGAFVYSFNTNNEPVRSPYQANSYGHIGFNSWSDMLTFDGWRYKNIIDDPVTSPKRVKNDFNHDGISDIGVYRHGTGGWSMRTVGGTQIQGFSPYGGDASDVPVTGDFNGDGYTDVGVYRAGSCQWSFKNVRTQTQIMGFTSYGGDPSDIPVVGDFNGDGTDDFGVYRAATGGWSMRTVTGTQIQGFVPYGGDPSDIPIVGDFDGDGADDIGVYRRGNGQWSIKSVKRQVQILGLTPYGGDPSDIPVVGDFNGDGVDDFGVYRHGNGGWSVRTVGGTQIQGFVAYGGDPSDVPVVGDFNGDGTDDIGVYRAGNGQWSLKSIKGQTQILGFTPYGGDPSDIAIGHASDR